MEELVLTLREFRDLLIQLGLNWEVDKVKLYAEGVDLTEDYYGIGD